MTSPPEEHPKPAPKVKQLKQWSIADVMAEYEKNQQAEYVETIRGWLTQIQADSTAAASSHNAGHVTKPEEKKRPQPARAAPHATTSKRRAR